MAKRVVTFAKKVTVKTTIARRNYTHVERNETWFTAEEMSAMKSARRATVKIMERGDPFVNDGQNYYRGLEAKTREGCRRKQFNQVDAMMAVLDEQESCSDPERISCVYKESTFHCQVQARERGLKDEQAALESLSEPCIVAPPVSDTPPQRRMSCRAA